MSLALIIPSYQDSSRLAGYLPELCASLKKFPGVSILVVDDGSGAPWNEETRLMVCDLAARYPMLQEPLLLEKNRGKGGAVYGGWDAAAPTEWIGFVDADGATSASEVARLIEAVFDGREGDDVYVGSRVKMLGRVVSRSVKRHLVGRIFATLSSTVTGLTVYDSQCGCKILRRAFYEKVKSNLVESRFAFDIDLLVNLALAGARMKEFPLDWSDIPGSKVSLVKDSIQMAQAVWRLRQRLEGRTVSRKGVETPT